MKKRLLCLLLCAVTVFMCFPKITANADDSEIIYKNESVLVNTESTESSEELLAKYVDKQMRDFGFSWFSGDYGATQMPDENHLKIYNELKAGIERIAAEGGSTEIIVSLKDPIIVSTEDYQTRFWEILGERINFSLIVDCLLADCPYELYWYDKTKGIYRSTDGTMYTDNTYTQICVPKLLFKFPVAEAFIPAGDTTKGYTAKAPAVSAEGFTAAQEAALAVVAANEDESDLEKLTAYKDYICGAVDYNNDALAPNFPYGNPWQLVWVFDGDTSTKVVCEGYSKAFQYLCELSTFDDENFESYLVTGDCAVNGGSGPHMWNQVTLNDVNYLVDVTNYDGNFYINATVANGLFMNSSPKVAVEDETYHYFGVPFGGSDLLVYQFDADSKALYPSEILNLGQRVHTYTDNPDVCDVCGKTSPAAVSCDVNGDGKTDVKDAALVYDHCNGKTTLDDGQLAIADVNKKDGVTVRDAMLIYDYCNKKISSFD